MYKCRHQYNFLTNKLTITGNVHIAYSSGDPTCEVLPTVTGRVANKASLLMSTRSRRVFLTNKLTITGNVHIAYSSGDPTCEVLPTVTGCASCHSLSPENALHLAATGVQVLIYMGQIRPASSSVGGVVNTRRDSLTDFHLQRKIEYKSGFIGND